MKVLIVEDDPLHRSYLHEAVNAALPECDTVIEAENGEEGLARCRAAMPDLVITDWNMPVMSGIEFIAQLRQRAGGDRPKVVFCTTENDVAHIREAIEAGADEYVMKPFDHDTLQMKLQLIGAA